jgi:hypothetical protein
MTTGVNCQGKPGCPEPAPASTHICADCAHEIEAAGGTVHRAALSADQIISRLLGMHREPGWKDPEPKFE